MKPTGCPTVSAEDGTLFEHCLRAIDRGMTAGAHGLPLFGSGDWNDGMNRVGHEGRGESTWLGFFLHGVLLDFAALCERARTTPRGERYRAEAAPARRELEQTWDGEWYRRGYYDDGTPLGSAQNDECRIDSIAQSWAVLSGAVPQRFAERAMDAVRTALVAARIAADPAARPAVRSLGAGSRLHQGVSAGRARKRRTVHARGRLGRDGAGAARQRRRSRRAVSHAQSDQPHAHTQLTCSATRRSRTSSRAMSTRVPPHAGRAGWSWYTGSAAWLYRAGLESMLGLRRRGATFSIDPCVPSSWAAMKSRGGTAQHATTSA